MMLMACVLMGGLTPVGTPQARAQAGIVPDAGITAQTKILPGCVLGVTLYDETLITGNYTVGANGAIRFSLADSDGGNKTEWEVSLRDKTTDEARDAVTESLKKYFVAPSVRVIILKMPRMHIEVNGAARRPGRYEVAQTARLTDALMTSGFTQEANLESVMILRGDRKTGSKPVKPSTLVVNVQALMRGESDEDPALQDGDKIVIPQREAPPPPQQLLLVRVIGEVGRESSLPIGPGMTVKDVIERAGGLKENADREKLRLIRGATGRDYELNADKIAAGDPVHNLPVEAGDLIIVGQRDRSLRFAVLGEVEGEQTFDWRAADKITLVSALERAGGPTKKGDLRKIILRRGYLNNPSQSVELMFDLEQIAKGKQPNPEILPGDAIILPAKQRKPNFFEKLLPILLRFLPVPI